MKYHKVVNDGFISVIGADICGQEISKDDLRRDEARSTTIIVRFTIRTPRKAQFDFVSDTGKADSRSLSNR